MDLHQLRKAVTDGTELEYLFDVQNDQWLPATMSEFNDGSHRTPDLTLTLLQYPRGHSDKVHLNVNDISQRLRIKGSN